MPYWSAGRQSNKSNDNNEHCQAVVKTATRFIMRCGRVLSNSHCLSKEYYQFYRGKKTCVLWDPKESKGQVQLDQQIPEHPAEEKQCCHQVDDEQHTWGPVAHGGPWWPPLPLRSGHDMDHLFMGHTIAMWSFPFRHRGTPSSHPFMDLGIFPFTKNHPAMGVPPWLWKPSCENSDSLALKLPVISSPCAPVPGTIGLRSPGQVMGVHHPRPCHLWVFKDAIGVV